MTTLTETQFALVHGKETSILLETEALAKMAQLKTAGEEAMLFKQVQVNVVASIVEEPVCNGKTKPKRISTFSAPRIAGGVAPRVAVAKAKTKAPAVQKRVKRTVESLTAMKADVAKFITKTPDCSVNAIADALKLTPKDLALPMRQMVAAKDIISKGKARGVRYFPGKK